MRRTIGAAVLAGLEALRRWPLLLRRLLPRRTLLAALAVDAALLRLRTELWLRRTRTTLRAGETIATPALLRRPYVTTFARPLLRRGAASVATIFALRAGPRSVEARTERVAIVGTLILWRATPVLRSADAVLIGAGAALGELPIPRSTMMTAMAVVVARLRAEITARAGLGSAAALVSVALRRRAFAARSVILRASLAAAVATTIGAMMHAGAAFIVSLDTSVGAKVWATRFAAIAIRAALPISVGAWAGLGSAGRALIATLAGFATFWTPLRTVAGTANVVRAELAVVVAVEFAQRVAGAIDFLAVDHAIVIRIERAEESGHRVAALRVRRAFTRRGVGRAGWWSVFLRRD